MKSETSRNVLLIALAVRLQRLVKNLPNEHLSPERITRKSLAEASFSGSLSSSEAGARKKANRYMDEMDCIFGLKGSESDGYVMARKFDTFLVMFSFWLEKISPPNKNDKRLHVMLSGLIHAISNAFSVDPIVVPILAQQLKEKYGNKNIRDTSEPLQELFDNDVIGIWLSLCQWDDDRSGINTELDPLLLRLKARSEVGNNQDISIILARPGRIHVIFDRVLEDFDEKMRNNLRAISEAVASSAIWEMDKEAYLPYILYREGQVGPVMLTLRNLSRQCYKDIAVEELTAIPTTRKKYIPLGLDEATWESFKQLAV